MKLQLLPDQSTSSIAALTQSLFGDRFTQDHEGWRELFSTDAFRFQEGLLPDERIALSYARLRRINAAVTDPETFVQDVERLAALHEWAGPADAGMATIASIHYNLFLGSLVDHDNPRDLRPFTDMRRIGTFLCTEAGHGNSASQMETTATYDPATRSFTLHTPTPAARKYMPNTSSAGGSKAAVVAARLITGEGTDRGVFLFLVPLSEATGRPLPGIHIERLPQTATSPVDHCATTFDNVWLPYEALLQGDHGRLTPEGEFSSSIGSSRKRFLTSVGRVTTGKLCMSAYSLGTMRHAVTVAVRHAHNRQTSGATGGNSVPLFAHRSHHAPLLDALATTYAANFLHRTALRTWAQAATAEQREDGERLTAIAKGWITWKAREVMTECRERCGAQGLLLSNGIAFQLAANEGTITAEGDNLVIWTKAAGELLLGHFTPEQPSPTLPEDRDLADSGFLQDLLADLARIWHTRARTRLRSGAAGGPLNRWNRTVGSALKLVDAYAHHTAAAALRDAAQNATHPDADYLLHHLHRLFALRRIAAYSGDLLADGRLTCAQVQELPDAIENAIEDLAPHAMTLAAGFAVSEDALLDHPITTQGSGLLPV